MIHVSSRNIDMELVSWLQSLSIDRDVIDKVTTAEELADNSICHQCTGKMLLRIT